MMESRSRPGRNELSPKALTLIRASLLVGVLLFGAAIWYVHRSGERPPASYAPESALRIALLVLLVAELPAILAVRFIQSRSAAYERRAVLALVGWALAEGIALFGGVIYLLTGAPSSYFIGMAVLVASFFLLPIPNPTGATEFRPRRT